MNISTCRIVIIVCCCWMVGCTSTRQNRLADVILDDVQFEHTPWRQAIAEINERTGKLVSGTNAPIVVFNLGPPQIMLKGVSLSNLALAGELVESYLGEFSQREPAEDITMSMRRITAWQLTRYLAGATGMWAFLTPSGAEVRLSVPELWLIEYRLSARAQKILKAYEYPPDFTPEMNVVFEITTDRPFDITVEDCRVRIDWRTGSLFVLAVPEIHANCQRYLAAVEITVPGDE